MFPLTLDLVIYAWFFLTTFVKNSKTKQLGQKFKMVAKTLQGLEEVLADELRGLGAENVEAKKRAVYFIGDKAMMYRVNYFSHLAISILKPIAEFQAFNEDELYRRVGKIDWSKHMKVDETFAITAACFSDIFTNSKYVALKSKDALVDQFREKEDRRPNVDVANPDLKINIHIVDKKCTVLLDSSGDPLFKRGYRTRTNQAPINEVLAAGMIKLSGWDMKSDFYDPMCGSGTMLIEAALFAYGIAPGTYRSKFGFEGWRDFDADLFSEIVDEAHGENDFQHTISGSDTSLSAVQICEGNIKQAFLGKKISVRQKDFFDAKKPSADTFVITNPPYGERMQPNDLRVFYQKIGDKLKIDYPGSTFWLIGSNFAEMKFIGLRPDRKIPLTNGSLDCSFRKFTIYAGKKTYDKKE